MCFDTIVSFAFFFSLFLFRFAQTTLNLILNFKAYLINRHSVSCGCMSCVPVMIGILGMIRRERVYASLHTDGKDQISRTADCRLSALGIAPVRFRKTEISRCNRGKARQSFRTRWFVVSSPLDELSLGCHFK